MGLKKRIKPNKPKSKNARKHTYGSRIERMVPKRRSHTRARPNNLRYRGAGGGKSIKTVKAE